MTCGVGVTATKTGEPAAMAVGAAGAAPKVVGAVDMAAKAIAATAIASTAIGIVAAKAVARVSLAMVLATQAAIKALAASAVEAVEVEEDELTWYRTSALIKAGENARGRGAAFARETPSHADEAAVARAIPSSVVLRCVSKAWPVKQAPCCAARRLPSRMQEVRRAIVRAREAARDAQAYGKFCHQHG